MEQQAWEERKKRLLAFIQDSHYVPMKQKEIAILLQVPREEREDLARALSELVEEGRLELSKRGKYSIMQPRKVVGIYSSHAKGFGFVSVEGQEEDIYIGREDCGDAFLGDTVEVQLKGRGPHRMEGVITAVLSHSVTEVIGTFEQSHSYGFVVPDNQRITKDIFIPMEWIRGARTGQKVVASITDYGRGRKNPEGRIAEILGEGDDPWIEVTSIVRAYDLPEDFSEKVLHQAQNQAKPVSEADCSGRLDLRHELLVTIDGEDARDLDDAVSLRREGDHYILGVHIADVANYVQENSALDWEAKERGTSVYLADRVIPMLPRELSNGICSLNAGEDRLALSCIMTIDQKGRIVDHTIAESVVRVRHRLSYTGVQQMLEAAEAGKADVMNAEAGQADALNVDAMKADPMQTDVMQAVLLQTDVTKADRMQAEVMQADVLQADMTKADTMQAEGVQANAIKSGENEINTAQQELISLLQEMNQVAGLLRERRRSRGSIDFDFPEAKLVLDEQGYVQEIHPYERNAATRLIEDFMLAANETVAEDYYWQSQPFIYRIHEQPDPDKMRKLKLFIQNFGYTLRVSGEEVHPKELQKLLDGIAGTPQEALLSRMTLRSMKQAKYSTECEGHFGLAASYYCHFTSPIRRYPDLQIHRIIKDSLRGRLTAERAEHYTQILPDIAKHSSETERRADEVEREVEKLKKAEYMEQHVGEVFEGVICGVTAYGFYVELPDTVEGLVHVQTLDNDFFEFDETACALRGARSGTSYGLGQHVRVRVKGTDRLCRTIDFILVDDGIKKEYDGNAYDDELTEDKLS